MSYCDGDKEAWKELSDKCKERANWQCERCGSKGYKAGGSKILNAHHKKRKSKGGRDELSNLVCLCVECHAKQPGHKHMRKVEKDAESFSSKLKVFRPKSKKKLKKIVRKINTEYDW